MDEEGLMTLFPRVCNVIAHDMINAVSYMHNLNMVHIDIKPANVLVSNMHYALKKGDCKEEFARCPIVCKLNDFGESRSQLCKTQAMLNNRCTKHLNRGSPAFMAPEVYVSKFMLHSANIDQLKAVNMWALLMTIFVSINPDQRYPYQLDLRDKNISNPAADLEETLKEMLILHKLPSGSEKYFQIQSCHYQKLREIIYNNLQFNPELRSTITSLKAMMQGSEEIEILSFCCTSFRIGKQ
eukprot:gene19661-21608_t